MDGEIWITSDGRAYLVSLQGDSDLESDSPTEDRSSEVKYPLFILLIFADILAQDVSEEGHTNYENLKWIGTCIHDFQTPKWVQKQRHVEPGLENATHGKPYFQPQQASCIAINNKFSLIAIGTYAGTIHFTNFPSELGVVPKSQKIDVPNTYNRQTGEVNSMEWTSDGYVLAVGWKHGWGIFSVCGKCLAFSVGVNDAVDEER